MSVEQGLPVPPEVEYKQRGQEASLFSAKEPETIIALDTEQGAVDGTEMPEMHAEGLGEPQVPIRRRTMAPEVDMQDESVVMPYDNLPREALLFPFFWRDLFQEALTYRNPHVDPAQSERRRNGILMRAYILCLLPIPVAVTLRSILAYAAYAAINPKDAMAQFVGPIKTLWTIGSDWVAGVRAGERAKEVREERKEERRAAQHQAQIESFRKAHAEEITAWAQKYGVSEDEATMHLVQKEFVEVNRDRILELFKLFTPQKLEEVLPSILELVQHELDDAIDVQRLRAAMRIPEALAIGVALGFLAFFAAEVLPIALTGFAAMLIFPMIMRIVLPHLEAGYDRARERYLKEHPQEEN